MKLVINKIILPFLFLSFYTYLIVHFTTMYMIKNEAINNLISFDITQRLVENNKSIDSFLNSNIKRDIALYNQNIFKFSNPSELYYILSMSNNEDWVCNSILKNSNNTNIKEFMKNRCGDYEKYKKHTPNKSL